MLINFKKYIYSSDITFILLKLTKKEIKRYGFHDSKGKLLKEGLYAFNGLVLGRNPFKSKNYYCYYFEPVTEEQVIIVRNNIHGLSVDKLREILDN